MARGFEEVASLREELRTEREKSAALEKDRDELRKLLKQALALSYAVRNVAADKNMELTMSVRDKRNAEGW